MKLLCLSLVLLTGCTIQLEDKRLTREEVAAAFQQRDEAIKKIVSALSASNGKEEKK